MPTTRTAACCLIALSATALMLAPISFAESSEPPVASASNEGDAKSAARAEIKDMLHRYATARYAGDVEAAKACVHHDVARRLVMNSYWGSPSPDWVRCYSHDQLAFYGTDYSRIKRLEPETGRKDVVIFDVAEFSASAMLMMEDVIDLVHVVNFDGEWVIMDSAVVFLRGNDGEVPEPAGEDDRAAIERVCKDYCVGFYEIDGEKVQNTCHTSLSKRTRQHAAGTDFDFLKLITWEEIWVLAKTFNREMGFDADTSRCDIDIYYADEQYAAAKMTGASWFDYFQLMKVNEEWQIVNIFYEALPEEEWSPRETASESS